jgi:hypothetical protein
MTLPDPTVLIWCRFCQDAKPYTEEVDDNDTERIYRKKCTECGRVMEERHRKAGNDPVD